MIPLPLKVIFFDIGDTLVKKIPGETRRVWAEGAKESLIKLKELGVRLGLISNTPGLTREQLFNDLLPTDFSMDMVEERLIILSSEVGVEKPKFRIFAHAIDEAEVVPGECLFCTENLLHTLIAQQIGMCSAWLQFGDMERLLENLIEDGLLATGAGS